MSATAILPKKKQAEVLQFPPASNVPDDFEAAAPEEEFEAEEAARVVFEEYNADKGVRS